MKEFKFSRQIYIILGAALLLALLIQTTRFQSFLNVGSDFNQWSATANGEAPVDALSAAEVAALDEDHVLVLYDPDEEYSVKVKENAVHLLGYMKKPYEAVNAQSYHGGGQGFDSVIVTMSHLDNLPDNTWIESFVEAGGSVLFAVLPAYGDNSLIRIYRKLGINELGDYLISEGIVMKSNVLVHDKGKEYTGDIVDNTSYQLQLGQDCDILAESSDALPLLWTTPYGSGRFVVFNGTMLQEKSSRGFFAGAISAMRDEDIYPVINAKLMYIDDFPAPFPAGYEDQIYEEYHRDVPQFFKEIWWPDMIRLASNHGLKYTGVVIETYNNQVKPPFPADADSYNLATYGRELLKQGGELGVHGYNHQSLTADPAVMKEYGYKPWASTGDMKESLTTVIDFIHKSFPDYGLHTYVPASNSLSQDGREALKQAWPDLRTISSVYLVDSDRINYEQEFEVAQDGIVEMPRITSGYKYDQFNDWAASNAITSLGIFSHFVHPDDILDPERSYPFDWDQLYELTNRFLAGVDAKWSWLRAMTANDASMEVARYSENEPHFKRSANEIDGYINHYMGGTTFYFLRSDRKITKQDDCRAYRIDDETYLIEAYDDTFSLGLEG